MKPTTNRLQQNELGYFFILPCALLILVILIFPVVNGIFKSFTNENLMMLRQTEMNGFSNYVKLVSDQTFLSSLGKSIIWTLLILLIEMIVGLFFASILNSKIYLKKFFRLLVLIPWVIPNAIAGIIWKWFLNESYGMMNHLLRQTGLISRNLPWLSNSQLAEIALVMVISWKSIPFVAITLLAGLQAIPSSLYEAAEVDGAGWYVKFRYITIPMIKKIMLITGILTSIWNFNQIEIIQVITRGGPGEATLTLPIYVYRLFMLTFQTGYASAAAVVMMIVLIIPTAIYVKKILEN
ncbi:sugar ABC transporter permease [Sphaerochaeta sp.]|uniref:carbohydrate ABC transporter permease n=1 Tax=Sphaerochaeta sp. TaxID=1972642 RepID=UPI002A372667|nr:sugar ABC transporter permease [Sphaerochaeta sp.]MDX9983918.1 sugar ABC transporter permease [Sphaerochaeta sp.]